MPSAMLYIVDRLNIALYGWSITSPERYGNIQQAILGVLGNISSNLDRIYVPKPEPVPPAILCNCTNEFI